MYVCVDMGEGGGIDTNHDHLVELICKYLCLQVAHYERRVRTLEKDLHDSKDQQRKTLDEVNFRIHTNFTITFEA